MRLYLFFVLTVASHVAWSAENRLPCWARLVFANLNPPEVNDQLLELSITLHNGDKSSAPLDNEIKNLSEQIKVNVMTLSQKRDLRSKVFGQRMVDITELFDEADRSPLSRLFSREKSRKRSGCG